MNVEEQTIDLYDFEIGRFKELLEEDSQYAYKRYGLTLLYSLETDETFAIRKELGWDENEALDIYNQGTIKAMEEDYDGAMKLFEQAEQMECDQPELFYNMAVIFEEREDLPKAKEYYQKYIDAAEEYDDIPKSMQAELDEVREHIKEI